MDDSFTLYDLKVEVIGSERPMVCSHKEGDYFLVIGENLVFPQTHSFSMYSLAALLPLLPAKQRPLDGNDWMLPVRILIAGQNLKSHGLGKGHSGMANVLWKKSQFKNKRRREKWSRN